MKATILLDYTENTSLVEEEERTKFLRNILVQSGLPIDEFWGESVSVLSIEQKMQLRNILRSYAIQVIDDHDGNMKIYIDDQLIAEWHKCYYKLRRDPSKIDPRNQLFLEMELNYWSLFDEES